MQHIRAERLAGGLNGVFEGLKFSPLEIIGSLLEEQALEVYPHPWPLPLNGRGETLLFGI
jgi:hypothetical protein